jgi:hypothetical protein
MDAQTNGYDFEKTGKEYTLRVGSRQFNNKKETGMKFEKKNIWMNGGKHPDEERSGSIGQLYIVIMIIILIKTLPYYLE